MPPQTNQPADIYLLGAGVRFPEQLTFETVEALNRVRAVFTNLRDDQIARLPGDIRQKCRGLWSMYRPGRPRRDNYRDVLDAVLEGAAHERPVAWLTPGHPLVFDSISAGLATEAASRGWAVETVPAVSCIDTILAEVGYDPASGLLVHEATGLVARQIPLLPSVATLLLQPTVFMNDAAVTSVAQEGPDLRPLRDYLARFYPPEHVCAFVRSGQSRVGPSRVTQTPIRGLAAVPFDDVAGSTLFIPRAP